MSEYRTNTSALVQRISCKRTTLALLGTLVITVACFGRQPEGGVTAARNVIERIVGARNIGRFHLTLEPGENPAYRVWVSNNKVHVTATAPVALCRGVYDYLTHACHSVVSWSGNRINIPESLPEYATEVTSPYRYHYYFNIVTHGYSTAFWDRERWEKEIDWMAVHGIDMPLLPGAYEAILRRVFMKLGLSQEEIARFFTGPAYLPWNKMGNITGWTGPLPESYYEEQLLLAHQIQERVLPLGMNPIVQAFAGFVPREIQRLFPEERVRELAWGGFDTAYHAYILEPGSALFTRIGTMYITEYEQEFGKQSFYLADSFNEMDVPLSPDSLTALSELAGYGEAVYRSIAGVNHDATWVMQGWTFPYQMKEGRLFWTPDRLRALVSKVPDNKLLILDMANEYNRLWWKSPPSWKMYPGFFGKQWIYSFIPNMGGKTALNGRLDLYATMPFEALYDRGKGNLAGFGFAPEGIENNEIIYELLSDVGWSASPISLSDWISRYCLNRYGGYPESMKRAFDCFNRSCFGSFTDHPRNRYQFRPTSNSSGTVNTSGEFGKGVAAFLACSDALKGSTLYRTDALEYTCQYLGLEADKLLKKFQTTGETDTALLNQALLMLLQTDRLLASHPNWRLENWTGYANKWGTTDREKRYYRANALRLITTWGGEVNEYAARTWSGLIKGYYVPRWREYYNAKLRDGKFDIQQWEEVWINAMEPIKTEPYDDPLREAISLFQRYHQP